MAQDILNEIIEKRKADIARLGICFGFERPTRKRPLHPFIEKAGTILEVKRSSPSKGNIAMGLDPAETARIYAQAGTGAISVLTESHYFNGSLADILKVAEAAPDCAILRKDFLLYPEEVDVAYDFGADAVLLIARILSDETLLQMATRTAALGMTPFVEVRTEDDLRKLKKIRATVDCVAGVNSRDLKNFHIDSLIPAEFIDELGERAVFESGIQTAKDAAFARRLGFAGVLIGEAAAKNQPAVQKLVEGFLHAKPDGFGKFWKRIAQMRKSLRTRNPGQPIVKICGITNADDALLAAELGANLLGFVFSAQSPRKTNTAEAQDVIAQVKKQFGKDAPLCVGVVTEHESPEENEALGLANGGILDAIQFHGCEIPAELESADFGYYKAVRLKSSDEAQELANHFQHGIPRALVDAYSPEALGGTGKRIDGETLQTLSSQTALWMAGGISADNIQEIVKSFHPELVDLSSALESFPGKKSAEKMRAFCRAVR